MHASFKNHHSHIKYFTQYYIIYSSIPISQLICFTIIGLPHYHELRQNQTILYIEIRLCGVITEEKYCNETIVKSFILFARPRNVFISLFSHSETVNVYVRNLVVNIYETKTCKFYFVNLDGVTKLF